MATPCTSDVQMATDCVPVEELTPGADISQDMMITLLDCEGQGDRGEAHDVQLMAPLLLVTKAVLYNWKGGLEKNTILQRLGTLVKAASMIATSQETTSNSTGKPFGHLHFVVRDWVDQRPESLTAVTKALLDEEEGTDEELSLRNIIRRDLKDNFESITIWLFPPPRDTSAVGKINFAERTPAFLNQLNRLRPVLQEQLLQPMEVQFENLNTVLTVSIV